MDPQQAYNSWAAQYDGNQNKTRDLEAIALRDTLSNLSFERCLEIGCGTGKNTVWLAEKAQSLLAVDLSKEMLAKAKEKVLAPNVQFVQADILQPWSFIDGEYDLVTFSLVLEHIEDLKWVFEQAVKSLRTGGMVYIGELHPFKQYSGSKARFETEQGTQVVTCFTHHISDFLEAAKENGLSLVDLNEYFDEDDKNTVPRILTIALKKGQ